MVLLLASITTQISFTLLYPIVRCPFQIDDGYEQLVLHLYSKSVL